MRRLLAAFILLYAGAAAGAGGAAPLVKAQVDLSDLHSLQRGARTFVNYCLSCHSAAYMRYSRMAEDLELTEEQVAENMMFTTDKIGSTMEVAMRPQDASAWFGVPPPDLSVIARARGADWLTTFLLGFYEDPARPTGVNNIVFPDIAMPHALVELEGLKRPVASEDHDASAGYEVVSRGRQDEREYRRTVRDLVNFLVYLGEPAKMVRYRLGVWVLVFLIGFTALAYAMKREYWKDVH
jgi:ubiquinol-cytochrome c reductase cytochrome c1 subunit